MASHPYTGVQREYVDPTVVYLDRSRNNALYDQVERQRRAQLQQHNLYMQWVSAQRVRADREAFNAIGGGQPKKILRAERAPSPREVWGD